jgi:hypothetical protein
MNAKWSTFGNVIALCDVIYYLGRNKIRYRCNNTDIYYTPTVQVYNLDIKFKSQKQFDIFKKKFG